MMLERYRVDAHKAEKALSQHNSQRIYLEAYCYSLELCKNPEIARQVASRFLVSIGQKEQASPTLSLAKP